MLRVECERDRVILDFCGRLRDLCLQPGQAERLAEAMETAADYCEQWMQCGGRGEMVKGERWNAFVKSWDGHVNVRFTRIGSIGLHDRVSIPFREAREIADHVRCKVTEARFRVHLAVGAVATNSGSPTC